MEHPLPTSSTQEQESVTLTLEYALFYARKGLYVLPLHSVYETGICTCGHTVCTSIGKHPLTPNGVKNATRDAGIIRQWWQTWPFANVGIATGKGLVVIDIDPRHGGSLEALADQVNLEHTSMVETGSGGWHLYFLYKREVHLRNTAGRLGKGIDTRANDGYVVAPPSLHVSGRRYRWATKYPLSIIPEPLLNHLCTLSMPSTHIPQAKTPAAHVERIAGQQEGHIEALQERSAAIPEGRRNTTLVSLAGMLRHWGANDAVLFPMLQVMNQTCCHPPLATEEVRSICHSASLWTPGSFPNPEERPSGLQSIKSLYSMLKTYMPEPRWTIPGLLPEGVTLLAGKPKKGKSWLGMGFAWDTACGATALGRLPTTQGQVLLLGLEDTDRRFSDRMRKIMSTQPASDASQVALTWGGFWAPLLEGGLDDLESWIKSTGEDARLIVIDTLARVRTTNGTSGNIYADDYAAITPLKQLAETYHLSILLIHHLRKNGATDPMDEISGSTGLTGATDCNMVLQREPGQDSAELHIAGRDVEEQTLHLTFDDANGRWSIIDAPEQNGPSLSVGRQAVLDVLHQQGRPLSPHEIIDLLDSNEKRVSKLLCGMTKDRQLIKVARGLYIPADSAEDTEVHRDVIGTVGMAGMGLDQPGEPAYNPTT